MGSYKEVGRLAMIVDLEQVDPRGRLDVLIYRGAETLAKQIEGQTGMAGIWDNLKPVVNSAVAKGMEGIEIPTELKVLLGIVQANWKKTQGAS